MDSNITEKMNKLIGFFELDTLPFDELEIMVKILQEKLDKYREEQDADDYNHQSELLEVSRMEFAQAPPQNAYEDLIIKRENTNDIKLKDVFYMERTELQAALKAYRCMGYPVGRLNVGDTRLAAMLRGCILKQQEESSE